MRIWMLTILLAVAFPLAAEARLSCKAWQALSPEDKATSVEGMIEGHLSSNKSQRYTSANRVRIRRCLESNLGLIVDDIDDRCGRRDRSADPVDDTFDKWLLSCVD